VRQVIRGTDWKPTETGCKEHTDTPLPAPKVCCGRTHVGYRTRNSLWWHTQTEHYCQLREPLAEGNNRHSLTCKQFQQAGSLHVKSSVAFHNTITNTEKRGAPPPPKKSKGKRRNLLPLLAGTLSQDMVGYCYIFGQPGCRVVVKSWWGRQTVDCFKTRETDSPRLHHSSVHCVSNSRVLSSELGSARINREALKGR